MRILGIGEYHSLGDMYWRLRQEGHDVRVAVKEAEAFDIFAGMNQRVERWEAQLDWLREAGREGLIVCESASFGEQADALRRDGFHVIGGSAFGDRIENDRAFGQAVMREAGMQTAPTHEFACIEDGIDFLRRRGGRHVLKWSDAQSASTRNYVGEMDDGADVLAVLEGERERVGARQPCRFVLMEHLRGVEVGIGAYFDGERFLDPPCIDWEHKRFFPGDLGELTGEMGTVVSYRGARRLFELTLARIAPRLREAGHCGYLNINTIVDERGVWPLEFTSRFGYPGFAICDALHRDGWGDLLARMAYRSGPRFATHEGYAVGVVLTVPPFPYEYGYAQLSRGARIFFREPLGEDDLRHLHYGEVALQGGHLVTSGSLGYVMVVTGVGADVAQAQAAAYARVRKVVIPNLRYRNDIGERLRCGDHARLVQWGYLDA